MPLRPSIPQWLTKRPFPHLMLTYNRPPGVTRRSPQTRRTRRTSWCADSGSSETSWSSFSRRRESPVARTAPQSATSSAAATTSCSCAASWRSTTACLSAPATARTSTPMDAAASCSATASRAHHGAKGNREESDRGESLERMRRQEPNERRAEFGWAWSRPRHPRGLGESRRALENLARAVQPRGASQPSS